MSLTDEPRVDLGAYTITPVCAEDEFLIARAHRPGHPTYILGKNNRRPTPATTNRLRDSFAGRARTRPEWAVPVVDLVVHEGRETIVYEDPGGHLLYELVGEPMRIETFLRVGARLATSLGRLHASGLIHRDLKPQYICVDVERDGAWIGGGGLAVRAARRRAAPITADMVTGSLAYTSPEQTGRMNRSVDSRSDLYSLGVIFYELLTGRRPFADSDPMALIHSHVARRPPPPSELVPSIPEPVSAIVMKLLAKTPEERYQSADGVAADLRRAAAAPERHFPLATEDFATHLLLGERLYGRTAEVSLLETAFEQAATGERVAPILIGGTSGVGKSALVGELQKALVPRGGMFASGKFDQNVRDVPYATLTQAFRELLRTLLLQPEVARRAWRGKLEAALGEHAALLTALLPELETLLGRTPPTIVDASPHEARLRFRNLYCRFVGALAGPDHPLVLFIDDLQWLDEGTLAIFEQLAASELRNLLLLGAYRDNEVGPDHPLAQRLLKLEREGLPCRKIVLAPLTNAHVGDLLGDCFRQRATTLDPLTELVHDKTGGNAFWVIHFVQTLHEEGLVGFDGEKRAWTWDLERIRAQRFTESVVDLMLARLARLPAATRSLLTELACVGPEATLAELATIGGHDPARVRVELMPAVDAGLVGSDETKVTFLHDRIQEAAYGELPPGERAARHLAIGRRLVAAVTKAELAAHAFVIANQLNRGLELSTDPDERRVAREVNLLAGRRALSASAPASASTYFAAAETLLADDAWEADRADTFECALSIAKCRILIGDAEAAEKRLLAILERTLSTVERAMTTGLLVGVYVGLDRNADAVDAGLRFLESRGIVASAHPGAEAVDADAAEVWRRIGDRAVADLAELPTMADPDDRATIDVLMEMYAPALFTDPNLSRLVISLMVNLTLERGTSDASAFAYVWFGAFMGRSGDYATAYRFGDLANTLMVRRDQTRYRARVAMVLGHFIYTYTRPLHLARAQLERAVEHAQADGEPNFLVYAASHIVSNALAAGFSLEETERDLDACAAIFHRSGFAALEPIVFSQRYVLRSLRGLPTTFGAFADQASFEQYIVGELKMMLVSSWMWIRKLEVAIYFGDYDTAIEASARGLELIGATPSFIEELELVFFSALAEAGVFDRASDERKKELRASLEAHHARLSKWAASSTTFAGRAALVGAEIARIDGHDLEAMRLYDSAIRLSREHDAPHHKGLAAEIASRFFERCGLEEAAKNHRVTARIGYLRWGATAKVHALEAADPSLRDGPLPIEARSPLRSTIGQLELAAVLRMAEAASSEIVLSNLVRTILRLVLEQSGAQRGVLVLRRGGAFVPEAEATTREQDIAYRLRDEGDLSSVSVPDAIVRRALEDRRTIVVGDALTDPRYASDPYVVAGRPRAILCVPLFRKDEPVGALYLENTLASGVFTPAQGALLELFASQVAAAIENARLYDELERDRRLAAESERLSLTGSYTWTPGAARERWSEQLYEILGYDTDTTPTMDLVVARIHPDDAPTCIDVLRRASSRFDDFTLDFRLVMPDGRLKHVENIARVVEDGAGKSVGYVGAIRDVTAAKTAEATLQDTRATLTHVTRVATFGEMAGAIAHEVNQPIAGAQLNAKAAVRWLSREPPNLEEAVRAADRIVRDTKRAGDVVARIRALFKKTGTERTAIRLDEAIAEVLELVRTDVRRHGATIEVATDDAQPKVLADRVQLQQVVVNLIVNAAEAMAGAESEERTIAISTRREGERLRVEVADTGPGIAPDDARKVFEPFHTTKAKGMGIGLAVSRTIVEDHGGTLDVSAERGGGARFYFTLPIAELDA